MAHMEHKDLVKLVELLEAFTWEVTYKDRIEVFKTLNMAREFVDGNYYEEDE